MSDPTAVVENEGTLRDDLRASLQEHFPDENALAGGEPSGTTTEAQTERDASGRFAPRTPAKQEEGQQTAQGSEQKPEGQQQELKAPPPEGGQPLRAPVSWKPEARAVWEKLDPLAQAEVSRREREITDTLRTTAQARQFTDALANVMAPYISAIQAEGATPLQAIQSVMQTAHQLRTGQAHVKAGLVADMIVAYGVDLEQLDGLLTLRLKGKQGQAAAPAYDDSRILEAIDKRLQPLLQNHQTQQQQDAQQLIESTEAFLNDPKYPYARDLQSDIADILDFAAARGQKISLQDAYTRATLLHPTISQEIQRKRLEESVEPANQAAQRARRAAASIPSNGAPGQDGGSDEEVGDDVRSAIKASMNQLNGQRR